MHSTELCLHRDIKWFPCILYRDTEDSTLEGPNVELHTQTVRSFKHQKGY